MTSNRAPYKNAIRSKKLIREAFITLLEKNEINKIKVKEIIDMAGISKGTFYAHYSCINNILEEVENEYLALMFRIFDDYSSKDNYFEDFYPIFLAGLEEIEKNKSFFTILSKNNFLDSFFGKAKNIFINYMMANYPGITSYKNKDIANAYFTYVAGGAVTLMKLWIEKNYNPSAKDLAKFINICIINGVDIIKN